MAGHGGRAVVEDHQQHVVLVEHGVGKAGHAGVEKRGVADEPDHRTIGNHGEPAAGGYGRSHAEQEVSGAQGRDHAERITADVAGIDGFVTENLADGIVHGAVRAAGAEIRRTTGQAGDVDGGTVGGREFLAEHGGQRAGHGTRGVFAENRQVRALAHDGNVDLAFLSERAEILLNQRLEFFEHQHRIAAGHKVRQQVFRQGPREPELKHLDVLFPTVFGERVGKVGTADPAGYDADAPFPGNLVPRGGFGLGAGVLKVFDENLMAALRHGGHGHETHGVAFKGHDGGRFAERSESDRAAQMVDAGGRTQHDRLLEFSGQQQGFAGHVLGFLRRGGLEAGHPHKPGVRTVVLFILAGMAQRIVGAHQHETAGKPHIRCGEQRIGGHVDAHVFHRGHAHSPGKSRASAHFHSHFLVDGILHAVSAARSEIVERVRDLG